MGEGKMGEGKMGAGVVEGIDLPAPRQGLGVAIIWKAQFEQLPKVEPSGNAKAVWKNEISMFPLICERQESADTFRARSAFVVEAKTVKTWVAPLRKQATDTKDDRLGQMLDMLEAALDAADDGMSYLQGELLALRKRHGEGA